MTKSWLVIKNVLQIKSLIIVKFGIKKNYLKIKKKLFSN